MVRFAFGGTPGGTDGLLPINLLGRPPEAPRKHLLISINMPTSNPECHPGQFLMACASALICAAALASCETTEVPDPTTVPGSPARAGESSATAESSPEASAEAKPESAPAAAEGAAPPPQPNNQQIQLTQQQASYLFNRQGQALQTQGKQAEAEASFYQAVMLDPNNGRAFTDLATALSQRGNFPAAEMAYRKAVSIDSTNLIALQGLGTMLGVQNKHAEAEKVLKKAVKHIPKSQLQPGSPNASVIASFFGSLGVSQYSLGKNQDAEEAFRQSIALNPTAAAYRNLGKTLQDQGKQDEADAAFQKAKDL